MKVTLQALKKLYAFRSVEVRCVDDIIKSVNFLDEDSCFPVEIRQTKHGIIKYAIDYEHYVDVRIIADGNPEIFNSVENFIFRGYIDGSIMPITLCIVSDIRFCSDVEVHCSDDIRNAFNDFTSNLVIPKIRLQRHGIVEYDTVLRNDGIVIIDSNFNRYYDLNFFIMCAFDK